MCALMERVVRRAHVPLKAPVHRTVTLDSGLKMCSVQYQQRGRGSLHLCSSPDPQNNKLNHALMEGKSGGGGGGVVVGGGVAAVGGGGGWPDLQFHSNGIWFH